MFQEYVNLIRVFDHAASRRNVVCIDGENYTVKFDFDILSYKCENLNKCYIFRLHNMDEDRKQITDIEYNELKEGCKINKDT